MTISAGLRQINEAIIYIFGSRDNVEENVRTERVCKHEILKLHILFPSLKMIILV